jgi:hypothetical protein
MVLTSLYLELVHSEPLFLKFSILLETAGCLRTTRRTNPENRALHRHRPENLKFTIHTLVLPLRQCKALKLRKNFVSFLFSCVGSAPF